MDREAAIVEAILFLENDPIDLARLVKISQLSKDVVLESLSVLGEKYLQPNSGLELSEIGGGYSLVPKTELWEGLKAHYGKKNDDKMSRAALETLSIIAYSQPLTRAEIESIRGVSASGIIKLLLDKELIKEVGRKDIAGKPALFGTTKEFLKKFGLNSIADLPKLDEAERERFELHGES